MLLLELDDSPSAALPLWKWNWKDQIYLMLCVFCVCQYRGRRKKHLEVKACAVLDFALSTLMWTLHHCASVLYGVHTHAPLAECVPEIVNVRERTCIYVRRWAYIVCLVPVYWVIQAGLLTPLTFAQHRLSPLAAFTSGVYFLHNGRRWQWICEFYIANFKGIFGGL